MPRKNSVKQYLEGGFYHIYNRGVEKRIIFLDERDYKTFLFLLKKYLDPSLKVNPYTSLQNPMNLSDEVDLVAYCLMPNHFHLLIHQIQKDGIKKIMQRVCTNYAMYFNRRYVRVGPLFQGIYKGVLIETNEQLVHVSRYIHRNPFKKNARVEPLLGFNPLGYSYSSLGDYLGIRHTQWIKPNLVLDYFYSNFQLNARKSYEEFVAGDIEVSVSDEFLVDVTED